MKIQFDSGLATLAKTTSSLFLIRMAVLQLGCNTFGSTAANRWKIVDKLIAGKLKKVVSFPNWSVDIKCTFSFAREKL